MSVIGLIAGNGEFPLVVAQAARAQGRRVVAVALREETDARLEQVVDVCHWISVGQLGALTRVFVKAGVREAVMAGQVRPERALGAEGVVDADMEKLLAGLPTKTTDAILGAIAKELLSHGIALVDSTALLANDLPYAGPMTRAEPTPAQWEDIRFGVTMARALGALDIGQTVVVKERAVLAVEAMEGTDAVIRRAGNFSRGAVVVKLAKPSQDMRFDVPVIGRQTIVTMAEVDASVLAVEAKRTLFLDRERVVSEAEQHGVTVVAVDVDRLLKR